MSGPERPLYVVALCEGNDCVRVADLDDLPGGLPTEAQAVALLERLATHLRERGALGRAVLLDHRRGAVVAERRVWP